MATFIIIPTDDSQEAQGKLGQLIERTFGNAALLLSGGEWLIAYEGTSKQLSDQLGISDNSTCTGLVLNFSGYWGYAGKNVWEWLAVYQK
jgi:hypothetical protein